MSRRDDDDRVDAALLITFCTLMIVSLVSVVSGWWTLPS